ncbi:MAG: DUF3494 domain-containing protein, partial [Saprospiraceae bacterium]|nr:DUF3494 domain-containing protein [Saprospiraceae bacterium]
MRSLIIQLVASLVLSFLPIKVFSQVVDLGAAASFALFTRAGAFNNVGPSVITGDVGTNVGAFTGFPPGIVIGSIHVADAVSAQAEADLLVAYGLLGAVTCGQVIGTTLGNGQILTPDVYCPGAASVINGDLFLDAEGDPNAVFIIKIDGALSTNSFSNVILLNGAAACNVYWHVTGAFSLGGNSNFVGTLLGGGAINLAGGSTINGQALTTAGAISPSSTVVTLSFCPPTITCPDPITVSCANLVPMADPAAVVAVATCPGDVTVTFTGDVVTGQTCDNRFTITRTYLVTDACDNTASCTQTIVVNDQAPPSTVTCPATLTISCEVPVPIPNPSLVGAIDACGGAVTAVFVNDEISGSNCPFTFTITRTYQVSDGCGNTTTCSQTINVADNTAPVITCPTVTATVECPALPIIPIATATDLCDPAPVVTFLDDITPGLCPQEFTIIRIFTATDVCGNATSCSVTVNVTDNTPPTLVCPIVVATVECPALPNFPAATATDLCDANPMVSFSDATTPGICPQEYTVTRTWTATDACGNATSCSRTIDVMDNGAPVITCPTVGGTIECSSLPFFPSATATDACGGTPMVTFTDATIPGLCPQEFMLTRTWTATDACGNTASCSRTINVEDNSAPVLVCPVVVASVECPALPVFPLAT